MAYFMDRSIYPKARAAFDLSEPEPVGWAFPSHGDDSLIDAANQFLTDFKQSGKLELLKKRSLEQANKFNLAGSQLFLKRIKTRLPKYQKMFEDIAEKNNMDWHLLAAISYQESHWNAKAKSPTGVRGLMMLTLPTAKEMGVSNRLDPLQSLEGGVKYFFQTKSRLPSDITEPDRTWLTLAAYNVGMGHLEDARVLTDRAEKNPDLWKDVKDFLPLLQNKVYYSTVRHGYARGHEPVQYVQNVLHYQSILKRNSLDIRRQKNKSTAKDIPHINDWSPGSLLSL
jgi:membrane-bound lytic murein transglycosylase F